MCGIFAYIETKATPDKLDALRRSFQSIQHRGPDHSSHIIIEKPNHTVFLGFHRLAIIDPSPSSDNFLQDNGVYLICNGEIYNYKYLIKKYNLPVKTGSDCEVILQLYKSHLQLWPGIFNELDGVFAFVLYDSTRNMVWCARDRFGVRPLFEGQTRTALSFASEGKAIPLYSAKQYSPGVFSVIDLDDTVLSNRWSIIRDKWINNSVYFNLSYESAQIVIRELFTEAVRKRLMSDRPIGFLVSGGLDSSLVASVAQRLLGKKITTFSIGLAGSPDLLAAKKVADYLGTVHHEIIITTQDIIDSLQDVIYHNESYDTTTTRASIPMYLISKYIRQNTDIKVIFSGEGADELLGGYLYFHKAPSYIAFQKESSRLIRDLHKYDLLRGDRTTARWGLEIRVPFLDADLTSFIIGLDPAHKMPGTHTIEKEIMRSAFSGYLPDEILYRQKEAFSDGIGYGSVAALKKYAEQIMGETQYCGPSGKACPSTAEEHLYYSIFQNYYHDRPNLHQNYYWMPRWHDEITDPSATFLDVHNSGK